MINAPATTYVGSIYRQLLLFWSINRHRCFYKLDIPANAHSRIDFPEVQCEVAIPGTIVRWPSRNYHDIIVRPNAAKTKGKRGGIKTLLAVMANPQKQYETIPHIFHLSGNREIVYLSIA